MKTRLLPLSIPLMVLAAACSDSTTGAVSLSLTTTRPLGAPLAAAPVGISAAPQVTTAGDSTLITLGNDTIILRSVELVLREIELKPVEEAACDTVGGDDGCEDFETGPVVVALPLGTTATERDLGAALDASGDKAGARAARERALAIFRRLGAADEIQVLEGLLA